MIPRRVVEKRKFHKEPANVTYVIDGASYGVDDNLVEAIRQSISRRLEGKNLDIPRLPQVAGRILQLSQSPDTDMDEIARTIMTDPVMVTRVLTVANSAACSNGQTIEGLMPAVMRLGLEVVRGTWCSPSRSGSRCSRRVPTGRCSSSRGRCRSGRRSPARRSPGRRRSSVRRPS